MQRWIVLIRAERQTGANTSLTDTEFNLMLVDVLSWAIHPSCSEGHSTQAPCVHASSFKCFTETFLWCFFCMSSLTHSALLRGCWTVWSDCFQSFSPPWLTHYLLVLFTAFTVSFLFHINFDVQVFYFHTWTTARVFLLLLSDTIVPEPVEDTPLQLHLEVNMFPYIQMFAFLDRNEGVSACRLHWPVGLDRFWFTHKEAQLLNPSDAQSVIGEHSGTCGCPAEAGSIASHNHTV